MRDLAIRPARNRAELNAFARLPRELHRADPRFIAQLDMLTRGLLDPRHSPILRDNPWTALLAVTGDRVVGRVLALQNHAHLARHGDGAGHFGFLEAVDDQAVFDALLGTAEQWLRERGLTRAVGPLSPSINYESGLEIDGLGQPATFGMNFAPAYYAERVAAAGYVKAVDLFGLAYSAEALELQPHLRALVARGRERGLTVRHLRPGHYDADIELLIDIYNDGWANNWGASPMQTSEARQLGKQLRALLRPEWVLFVEYEGTAIAAALQMPDLNEAARDLNGSLFPLGWMKLLWRMRRPSVKNSRLLLLGVREQWHRSALGPLAALTLIEAVFALMRHRGMSRAELGWILETNTQMLSIASRFPGMRRKTYRIFEKSL